MLLPPDVDAGSVDAPSFGARALTILWPAFVMAGVLEALVFVVVDPETFAWWGGAPLAWTRSAVYTVTFFIFWGVISTSAAITQLLHEQEPRRRCSRPTWRSPPPASRSGSPRRRTAC
jgi:hypothetical protein